MRITVYAQGKKFVYEGSDIRPDFLWEGLHLTIRRGQICIAKFCGEWAYELENL